MTTAHFEVKTVYVRKGHPCIWCGYLVQTGQRATVVTTIVDGVFIHEYFHRDCYDYHQKEHNNDDDD